MFGVNGFVSRDDEGWAGILWERVTAFTRAAGQMDAHDAFRRVVLGEKVARGDFDFREGAGQRDFQEISAALEAFEMFAPEERLAIGDANRFEQPVAIKETAVIDRQRGPIGGNVLSVYKCEHGQLVVTRCRFDQSI